MGEREKGGKKGERAPRSEGRFCNAAVKWARTSAAVLLLQPPLLGILLPCAPCTVHCLHRGLAKCQEFRDCNSIYRKRLGTARGISFQ
uniref:Uncharacterized protein n=1 Tax=Oryza rufipogon TaxID=4529 RepID=A0A0E0QZZ5_ORYRU